MSKKILVIPDTQVSPGVPLDHLQALGSYIVKKKPDIIVQIGDFADMPSLSSYDVGKRSFEGRRYTSDVEAARRGMETLLEPIDQYNEKAAKNHDKRYTPRKVLTLGNHEQRIIRATEDDAKLDGVLSIKDLDYEKWGWEVYPFLEPVVIEGICFNHYFPSGVLGRPITTAMALLRKMHMSCIAGHLPGLQFHREVRADGKQLTAIIAGSFYMHDESYMHPIVNKQHWRGVIMLHGVNDGDYDIMPVSLRYLMSRYSKET